MHRLDTAELLDEEDAPQSDMERSLRDLRRFNSIWGGQRAYQAMLQRLLGERRNAVVIDLGAGTADLLDSLGFSLTVAVDLNIRHLLYERDRSRARRVVADARQLPFRTNAADAVSSSHFFHHFSPDENAAIIRESLRIARVGVAFTDTARHLIPLLFTRLLGALRLVGRITRNDAPASVRRGYTASEVRAIAERSDAPKREVIRLFPFRWAMLLWKRA